MVTKAVKNNLTFLDVQLGFGHVTINFDSVLHRLLISTIETDHTVYSIPSL